MEKILDAAKARLKEKSTWTALVGTAVIILAKFGIIVPTELVDPITTAVGSIFAVVLVATQAKA